jgi:hypothetical protein
LAKFKGIIVKENGILFFFKYDQSDPTQLHIFVRHLASIEDALDAYFDGTTLWNEENQRFESTNETHTLYWFWLDEKNTKVMIISCFKSGE